MPQLPELVARPVGKNDDDKNESGIVILLQVPGTNELWEIGRVGRVRENTLNPEVSFDTQVDKLVADAQKIVQTMRELSEKAGELQ